MRIRDREGDVFSQEAREILGDPEKSGAIFETLGKMAESDLAQILAKINSGKIKVRIEGVDEEIPPINYFLDSKNKDNPDTPFYREALLKHEKTIL